MFFYFKPDQSNQTKIQVSLDESRDRPLVTGGQVLYLNPGEQAVVKYDLEEGKQLWLMGDPVRRLEHPTALTIKQGSLDLDQLYDLVPGHYYWFLIQENQLRCGSSFGAIYPVYHYLENANGQISSSATYLAELNQAPADDRRYILERSLFNYPLFNATWWTKIKLLPAHSELVTESGSITQIKTLDFSSYSGSPVQSETQDLNNLADHFIQACNDFWPSNTMGISFTGGFDGRTLVGIARYQKQSFFTYSFGESQATDIQVPARHSALLGITYLPIVLDEEYLNQHAIQAAKKFMELSDYTGNIGRPHYLYSASELSKKASFIITGNFGSELFRALHIPGMMMTQNLIDIFSTPASAWKDRLRTASHKLHGEAYSNELEGLIGDIECYLQESGLDGNPRFYRFVFEELFRKYFGPELIVQSNFLNNRTPFLQYAFVKELNKTIWSGVHRPLFETSKTKRMVGQLFYAQVLKNTDQPLYRLKTAKGYSPADVLELSRRPVLLARYFMNKYLSQQKEGDNLVNAILEHFQETSSIIDVIKGNTRSINRENQINLLSLAWGLAELSTNLYASSTYQY